MIIGLAGYAGSGKDLVGRLLKLAGFERRAFADALKGEVAAWLDGNNTKLPSGVEWSRAATSALCYLPQHAYIKPTPPAMRSLLQEWGTEYRRAQDNDYWVKKVLDSMESGKSYVITDVRFDNEAAVVRARGGKVLFIEREHVRPVNDHASETALSGDMIDFYVSNNGSIEELVNNLDAALYACKG